VPVENRGAQARDFITADISIALDGNEITEQKGTSLMVQAGRIGGIFIEDLDTRLDGTKPGETRSFPVKVRDDHLREDIRGKEVEVKVALNSIKRLELAEINQQFLENLGFEDERELKDALMEQLQVRLRDDIQQAMRDQVTKYLIENVTMAIPAKLSQRQRRRVLQRRISAQIMRGIPESELAANAESIEAGADEQAVTELKAFFILDRIAQDQNVDIPESELNGVIAYIASQRGERPESLKQRMSKDGSLMNMYLKMRENKALDRILQDANIEDVEVERPKA